VSRVTAIALTALVVGVVIAATAPAVSANSGLSRQLSTITFTRSIYRYDEVQRAAEATHGAHAQPVQARRVLAVGAKPSLMPLVVAGET